MKTKSFTIKIHHKSSNTPFTFVCGEGHYSGEVSVACGGLPAKNAAEAVIYGLSKENLEQLTNLIFLPPNEFDTRNRLEILVEEAQIFYGSIYFAFANFLNAPEVSLHIVGAVGIVEALVTATDEVYSAADNIPLETTFRTLVDGMSKGMENTYTLINNGVKGTTPDIVLRNSFYDKIRSLAYAMDINLTFDSTTVIIAPKNGPFYNNRITVSPMLGLIGYPSFTSGGINFKYIFNPLLKVGMYVDVISSVPKATGSWFVNSVTSRLSTVPGGAWESEVETYVNQGFAQ